MQIYSVPIQAATVAKFALTLREAEIGAKICYHISHFRDGFGTAYLLAMFPCD